MSICSLSCDGDAVIEPRAPPGERGRVMENGESMPRSPEAVAARNDLVLRPAADMTLFRLFRLHTGGASRQKGHASGRGKQQHDKCLAQFGSACSAGSSTQHKLTLGS